MRADAQRNAEKLRSAAAELFQERGLRVPLKEIARRAGVSHGTLYNLFGTREALIDEVVTDRAARHLDEITQRALAFEDAWEGFTYYVEMLCALQATDPAVADVISGRYPGAERLMTVCDRTMDAAQQIVRRAHEAGALRPDFTNADLVFAFAANALLARATAEAAPDAWRRQAAFLLDGLRTEAARSSLPADHLTRAQVEEALRNLGDDREA
ncbi:TetR/AcrR family transcriptional regulator [Streptomyces tubbatahanensis]|uniref:TetR/AcrR family transcriptional regulator n=1 Tax=Streptomyces tubbatahanensis TaxID=2923272 RepID=A0ABY3Y2C3_9ACTN|nr:helix-turn-helix domain-containing protein [Streptomyces tubbatahanensis]UNT00762.1 TetR/AcrR family transcriptional regulator [Streptomyces tubbatahanensis]